MRSQISAFVIRFLKRSICTLATGEISIFWLVSVAEETGLKLALTETPKTGFLAQYIQIRVECFSQPGTCDTIAIKPTVQLVVEPGRTWGTNNKGIK